MPRGHDHISFVFSSAFRDIFRTVFLEKDCNGKKDPCAVFGCNNDRLFPEKYTVKDHISNTKLEKRRSLLHPNTAQGSFFPLQSYSMNKVK